MRSIKLSAIAIISVISLLSQAEDKVIQVSLFLSANGQQGATESDNIVLGLEAGYEPNDESVWGFFAQSDLQRNRNKTVTRSYDVKLTYDKDYLNSPWGWYSLASYEVDAFQDIEKETTLELGLKLDALSYLNRPAIVDENLFKTWELTLGTLYNSRQDIRNIKIDSQGITVGSNYNYEYKDNYIFNNRLAYEFFPNQDELDTIVISNSISFPFATNKNIKLKLGLDYEYFPNINSFTTDYELRYYSNIVWKF